jgi:hypothetical protein
VVARHRLESYVSDTMLYGFSFPTKSDEVPTGSGWIHEIKYDCYRMMLIRDQDRVRLISRGGHDWAQRFPLIVAAALKLRQKHFVMDGEVVVLDKDGVSDFDALASRKHDNLAQFYAFDMLDGNGEDLRPLGARATQGQTRSAALAPGRWHLHRRARARRHRLEGIVSKGALAGASTDSK